MAVGEDELPFTCFPVFLMLPQGGCVRSCHGNRVQEDFTVTDCCVYDSYSAVQMGRGVSGPCGFFLPALILLSQDMGRGRGRAVLCAEGEMSFIPLDCTCSQVLPQTPHNCV